MITHLKQLKLTAVPSGSNPVMDQRMRLVRRLEEQKQLAADPHYVRVTRRWTGKAAAMPRSFRASTTGRDAPRSAKDCFDI